MPHRDHPRAFGRELAAALYRRQQLRARGHGIDLRTKRRRAAHSARAKAIRRCGLQRRVDSGGMQRRRQTEQAKRCPAR